MSRRQTKEDLRKIKIEEDMLQGNINRMCVCEDMDELIAQHQNAIRRLNNIMIINKERLSCNSNLLDSLIGN